MSPRPGRPRKPRIICDRGGLEKVLGDVDRATEELRDWVAVYQDEPGTSARVLLALRRNLNTVLRTADAMWRDAHDQEIELALRAAQPAPFLMPAVEAEELDLLAALQRSLDRDSGARHDLADVVADLDLDPPLPRRPADRFTIIRGEKP